MDIYKVKVIFQDEDTKMDTLCDFPTGSMITYDEDEVTILLISSEFTEDPLERKGVKVVSEERIEV